MEDIPYLHPVAAADGRSVIVGPHLDYWSSGDHVQVYSMMKKLRGAGMGYLEAENRVDSLDSLKKSDPDIDFLILVNGKEFLYASDKEYRTKLSEDVFQKIRDLQENTVSEVNNAIYTKVSSSDFELTVYAYKMKSLLGKERRPLFFHILFGNSDYIRYQYADDYFLVGHSDQANQASQANSGEYEY